MVMISDECRRVKEWYQCSFDILQLFITYFICTYRPEHCYQQIIIRFLVVG